MPGNTSMWEPLKMKCDINQQDFELGNLRFVKAK